MVQEKAQINAQRLTSVWNVCGPPSGDFTVGWSQVWRGAWRRNSARLPADCNFLGEVVPSQNGSIYRFGVFELDLRTPELRKKGVKLKLQEQPCQILLKLLEHPGEMVSRKKLRATLWHEDTFVDFETGLNTAIKRLRETLGDSADNPTFIQTLPRRGYKFIAPVEIPASHDSETGAAADIQESSWGQDLLKRAGLVAAVAVLLLIGWAVWYRQPRPPTVTNAVRLSNDRKAKSPLNSPVTDGVHLYFIEGMPWTTGSGIAQMSATGGETTWITTTLKEALAIYAISPDRSELLSGIARGLRFSPDVCSIRCPTRRRRVDIANAMRRSCG